MKIEELSPVLYSADLHEGADAVSVGWLGTEVPATGALDPGLLEAVTHFCDYHSVSHEMGLHECELCRGHEDGGEWWIDWRNKRYVLPRMTLHYIRTHDYLPPEPFRCALGEYWSSIAADLCRRGVCTPVVVAAAKEGRAALVIELLQRGADGTATDQWHSTPLSASADRAELECVEVLLNQCTYTTKQLNEALHATVGVASARSEREGPRCRIARLLLEAGADVNGRSDPHGRMPLERALTQGARALVELLLEFGADVKARNKEGLTMLEQAERRNLDWLQKDDRSG